MRVKRIEWFATSLELSVEFIIGLFALAGLVPFAWLSVTFLALLAVQFACVVVGRQHLRAVNIAGKPIR